MASSINDQTNQDLAGGSVSDYAEGETARREREDLKTANALAEKDKRIAKLEKQKEQLRSDLEEKENSEPNDRAKFNKISTNKTGL